MGDFFSLHVLRSAARSVHCIADGDRALDGRTGEDSRVPLWEWLLSLQRGLLVWVLAAHDRAMPTFLRSSFVFIIYFLVFLLLLFSRNGGLSDRAIHLHSLKER